MKQTTIEAAGTVAQIALVPSPGRHVRTLDADGQPRVFRRLRARWLRWQKPRRRR